MSASEPDLTANDQRVADDISKYGCHVVSVFDPKNEQPNFTYSVGIQASTGAPEAIVIGVKPELGHFLINQYKDKLRQDRKFERGVLQSGFLKGFGIYIEPAKPRLFSEYTFGCDRYYRDKDYSVVQLIYPTTDGIWPWQATATEWFRANQPLLGRKRPDRK